jgi:hypothetical protein
LARQGEEVDRAAYFSEALVRERGNEIEPWCQWLILRALSDKLIAIPPRKDNPYAPMMAYL